MKTYLLSSRPRKAFTLIELLVVIAIIAILASILFPVFARARENARRSSCQSNLKQVGIGMLQYVQDYDEMYPFNSSFTPGGAQVILWPQFIQPYIKSTQVFRCPSDTASETDFSAYATNPAPAGTVNPFHTSYIANINMLPLNTPPSLASVVNSSGTVLMTDGGTQVESGATPADATTWTAKPKSWILDRWVGANGRNTNQDWAGPNARHLMTANVLFADGHVKAMRVPNFYNATSDATWLNPAVGGS